MASQDSVKTVIYGQLARIGKAIASPPRLELLDLLCQAPRSVDALASETGLSVANTSQHLQVLHGARLVERDKQGQRVVYRVADQQVATFFSALGGLAESRLSEMQNVTRQFLDDRDGMERVDEKALLKRVKRGEVTVIDVRPAAEFEAGHAAGAISLPIDELMNRINELPKDREVVAYCRGPYCVFAVEATRLLRARGFNARRLEHSVADLRERGVRIEGTA